MRDLVRAPVPVRRYRPSAGDSRYPLVAAEGEELPPPVNGGGLPECPAGYLPLPDGTCQPGPPPCPEGYVMVPGTDAAPECVSSCPPGYELTPSGCEMIAGGWWASQSTGVKVAIGVGGVAVVGLALYLALG
jgi:hypothetical protein